MYCAHPIGDSHDSAPPLTSPMARSTYETPRATPARPRAARLCSVTWAVTAVRHAKNIPKAPIAAPKRIDPSTATSWLSIERVMSAPSRVYASAATTSTAVTGALRPTTVARMSSVRPSSSSARVWRPTRNIPISATTT